VIVAVGCARAPMPPLDEAAEATAIERAAREGRPAEADRRARALLAAARDPAAASSAVRLLAAGDCGRLRGALEVLDARAEQLAARVLLGLADDAREAARTCTPGDAERALDPSGKPPRGAATAISLARLRADRPKAALETLSAAPPVAARRLARAEVLLRLHRRAEAASELKLALEQEDDGETRVKLARLYLLSDRAAEALALASATEDADGGAGDEALEAVRVAALSSLRRAGEAVHAIDRAGAVRRAELAREAVRAARDPAALVVAASGETRTEILWAIAERMRGGPASLGVLELAFAGVPEDARIVEALADARAAAGLAEGALAAWDLLARLAPASERARLEPIGLLARGGRTAEARARAARLAASARAAQDADALLSASASAAAAGDHAAALALARAAIDARPDDGRMRFLYARRLEENGQAEESLRALRKLLICGAHARPWHRHEVAGQLIELARRAKLVPVAVDLLRHPPPCEPPEPNDLRVWVDGALSELTR
jgi:hypothetical protein